uniref:Uncharacterized protein n=1 Tax=Oryza glumipatula TaxID=40148 RepID=A0A0D9ZD18_9ORYZ
MTAMMYSSSRVAHSARYGGTSSSSSSQRQTVPLSSAPSSTPKTCGHAAGNRIGSYSAKTRASAR